jgi:hypothetical protein
MDSHTPDTRLPVTLPRLWFGVFAAPTAWVAALLLGYVTSCTSRDVASGALLVLLAGMLAVALVGLIVAFANWRSLGQVPSPSNVAASDAPALAPWWGRSRFLAGGGLLTSALFLVGIVFFAISASLAPTCSRMQ